MLLFSEWLLTQLSIKSMPEFCWGKNTINVSDHGSKCLFVSLNLHQQLNHVYGEFKAYFSLACMAGWAGVLLLNTTGTPQYVTWDFLGRVPPCRMIPICNGTGVNIWMAETGTERQLIFFLVYFAICRTWKLPLWNRNLNQTVGRMERLPASGQYPEHGYVEMLCTAY